MLALNVILQRYARHLKNPAFALRSNQGNFQDIIFRAHILFVNSVHI